MIDELGKKNGSGRGLIEILSLNFYRETEESDENICEDGSVKYL